VEHGHPLGRAQPGQRGLELQRLLDSLTHEALQHRLAPRLQGPRSEAPGEALDAGEAHALDLHAVSVEHAHAGLAENRAYLLGVTRLEVVVAEHAEHRHLDAAQLAGQHARLVGQAIVGEVAAEHEHVGALGGPGEQRLQRALRALAAVHVADRRHPEDVAVQRHSPAAGRGARSCAATRLRSSPITRSGSLPSRLARP
jgi:hypothetical protein